MTIEEQRINTTIMHCVIPMFAVLNMNNLPKMGSLTWIQVADSLIHFSAV